MKRLQSPTSINTFLTCPRKYYLKYIKGLKEKPNIHLIRGQAVHNAIARFSTLDTKDLKDFEGMETDLFNFFNESWLSHENEIQGLGLEEETLKEIYQESTLMLTGWLKRYLKGVKKGQKELEVEIKLISENHGVMGFIDAVRYVNDQVFLVDYKTSKSEDMTRDIRVQMSIYALLFKETFGILPHAVIIDFLKHQSEAEFKVTEKVIEFAIEICKEIHEKTSSTNEEDYPCTCGGWCEKDFLQDGHH